ncbi:TetR/AcrR family transcriptional regulator [Ancylobacter mangrovi]|uniref:TetR/AcrR family transcriptional regulator n=1 Tax=Ancylobacter mangrovi TaxID=2972472 RepID=UPI002161E67F|nr:TetR/AcrR family transcriptional regulator [Ancylobacter mangrovi]MCS0501842.1 TetR/AcrR family transcriptional regulator [Ancylobacter mangrovi]
MLEQVPRRRTDTRERLLGLAEQAILAKGFASTSIDELIAGVGITKSGFFYHFRDKNDLARALLERHIARDRELLDDIFRRADELNDDPLHGFLVGLRLFAEMMDALPEAHPGCLAATLCYQDQLFDRTVHALNAESVLAWRRRFRARLEAIAASYPSRQPVDLDALADMLSTLVEGGLVMGRALKDPTILPRQILLFRDFLRLTFAP